MEDVYAIAESKGYRGGNDVGALNNWLINNSFFVSVKPVFDINEGSWQIDIISSGWVQIDDTQYNFGEVITAGLDFNGAYLDALAFGQLEALKLMVDPLNMYREFKE